MQKIFDILPFFRSGIKIIKNMHIFEVSLKAENKMTRRILKLFLFPPSKGQKIDEELFLARFFLLLGLKSEFRLKFQEREKSYFGHLQDILAKHTKTHTHRRD